MNEHVATTPVAPAVNDMDRYLFDLNGYLILKQALTPAQVAACNATYDEIEEAAKAIAGRGWWGNVAVNNSGRQEGIGLQQLYEAGSIWEELLDHPAWYDKCIHFIGTDDPENFDTARHSSTSASVRSGRRAARSGSIRAATSEPSATSSATTRANSIARRSTS